ncbi:MAG: hypothetical protein J5988_08925 [Eubacterium sp.]|nr:hypothetical protein [Eubacterium sp.]
MRPKKKGYSPILLIFGAIAAVVAAYYCAAGMRAGETIFIWRERMQVVLKAPFEMYFNEYTGKTVMVFLFIYILLALMYVTSRRNYLSGREMGSAQYADVKKVNRRLADLSVDTDDPENIIVPLKKVLQKIKRNLKKMIRREK